MHDCSSYKVRSWTGKEHRTLYFNLVVVTPRVNYSLGQASYEYNLLAARVHWRNLRWTLDLTTHVRYCAWRWQESTASEAATPTSHRVTMPPVTADAHSGSRVTSDGSTRSPSVDVNEQSSGSADDDEATSQRALPPSVADDELLGRVDAAVTAGVDTLPPTSDTADQTTTSTGDNLLPPPTTVDHVPDDHVAGQEADQAAALTAAAEALVRQSTAAVAPLILASTGNVEELEKHHLL